MVEGGEMIDSLNEFKKNNEIVYSLRVVLVVAGVDELCVYIYLTTDWQQGRGGRRRTVED
jgi:hypothetical protein